MDLLTQIRMDVAQITGDTGGFATSILFETPAGQEYTIPGTRTKHHLGFDPVNGNRKNVRTASISVSESALKAASYPYRNVAGEVHLATHKVSYADASGRVCKYVIREWYPDETLGLIVCILGDFK